MLETLETLLGRLVASSYIPFPLVPSTDSAKLSPSFFFPLPLFSSLALFPIFLAFILLPRILEVTLLFLFSHFRCFPCSFAYRRYFCRLPFSLTPSLLFLTLLIVGTTKPSVILARFRANFVIIRVRMKIVKLFHEICLLFLMIFGFYKKQ